MLTDRTKKSRKVFTEKYSRRTAAIIRAFVMKRRNTTVSRSQEIMERLCPFDSFYPNKGTVAATLANLTRGTYTPFVTTRSSSDKLTGNCKY